jgi:broad specificity phosphatase PhoE
MTGLGLTLTLVRHGESVGNVAAAQAHASNSEVVDVPARDADVCLSERGIAQARALGSALAAGGGLPAVDSLWCSPYLRAQQTAQICLEEAGVTVPGRIDERLRDRDLGVLDTLTGDGIQRRHPEEAARRRWLGKFYHRPAGGESWADVIGRVRSVMRDISDLESGRHVLVVSHDVVIMSFRYVAELLTEDEVLSIAGDSPLLNASVTHLARDADGRWHVERYNDATHVERSEAAVTRHPGERHEQPG